MENYWINMHVTDICSIFGNALDNAIEHDNFNSRSGKKTDPSDSIPLKKDLCSSR